MADEEIQQYEDEELVEEEQEEVELAPVPPVQPDPANEWKGRLEKIQQAVERYGVRYDPNSDNFIPITNQAGNYPTTGRQPAPPQEEEFDYEPESYKKLARQEAQSIVAEVLGQLLPVIDTAVDSTVASANSDWSEIKGDVLNESRRFGYTSLAALKANPDAFELFVNAARGKRRASAPAAAPAPAGPSPDEIARQAAIAAAASVGASGGAAPTPPQKLGSDERMEAKQLGVTEDEYRNLKYGPATIGGGS